MYLSKHEVKLYNKVSLRGHSLSGTENVAWRQASRPLAVCVVRASVESALATGRMNHHAVLLEVKTCLSMPWQDESHAPDLPDLPEMAIAAHHGYSHWLF